MPTVDALLLILFLSACGDSAPNNLVAFPSPSSSKVVYLQQLEEGFTIRSNRTSEDDLNKIVGINECNNIKIGWQDDDTLIIKGRYAYFTTVNYFEAARIDIALQLCIDGSSCQSAVNWYDLKNCSQYNVPATK